MVEVRWTEGALAKLDDIAEFIAREDPLAAKKIARRIWRTAHRLGKFPRLGYPVPNPSGEEVRQIWAGNYRIVYVVMADRVEIWGVAHKRQQAPLGEG